MLQLSYKCIRKHKDPGILFNFDYIYDPSRIHYTEKPLYNDTVYNDKLAYSVNCFSPKNKGRINIQPVYNDMFSRSLQQRYRQSLLYLI